MNKNLITKKILCLAILSILVITLTGCFSHTHKFIDGICECGVKEILKYKIDYDLDGGSFESSNPTLNFNSGKDVILLTPVKEGYEFLGWYEVSETNLSNIKVESLENRNYSLVAKWKKLNDNDIHSQLSYLEYKNYKIKFTKYEIVNNNNNNYTLDETISDTGVFSYYEGIIAYDYKTSSKLNSQKIEMTDYLINDNTLNLVHKARVNINDVIVYDTYTDSDDEFKNIIADMELLNIEALSGYTYTYKNDAFYLNETNVVIKDLNIPLDYSKEKAEVEYVSVKLENNKIALVEIRLLLDTDNKISYTYSYEFFDYDNVDLDISDINSKVYGNQKIVTSSFTDVSFNTNDGPSYKANKPAKAFIANKGVQFMQKSGEVLLTSNTMYFNVRSVKVTCQTNQDLGMILSVMIDNVSLYSDGKPTYNVKKSINSTEVEFIYPKLLTGNINIKLTPNADDKSMYISKVEVICDDVEFDKSIYMPKQNYDENTHSDRRLQDYLMDYNDAIGLSSTGSYPVLVIPIEFKLGSSFSKTELNKLDTAFNGNEITTGYESVKSYYQKSSYNKLNMSFDIVSPYKTKYNARYYNNYYEEIEFESGDTGYQYGEEVILLEALRYYEAILDLSKYDYNKDNVIDGVYLIYNHSIDYYDEDSMFWAYTTWYTAPYELNQTFDGLDAYYYMFAGYDFIEEDVKGGTVVNDVIDGLKVNATTFIHETGHMLGLDDYYDYYDDNGSDMGLGGVDIMDGNNGDHNAYSKTMMNWITPKIVTETQTITINPMSKSGDAILVPLDYNNSYMCEYLLIDLYTNDGLNAMQDSINNMYGTGFGVRIYHVSSSANKPYSDDYQSYTDNNNSSSDIPLIKLVEADGDKNFRGGYAQASDLWVKGQMLSSVYGKYARNDGKFVNFDIIIHEVSSNEAVITIEYYDM